MFDLVCDLYHSTQGGGETLDLISKNKYCLFILDVMMTEMNGNELALKINERKHLTSDLYDSLGQLLATSFYNLDGVKNEIKL